MGLSESRPLLYTGWMKNSTSSRRRRLTLAREAVRTLQVPELAQAQGGMPKDVALSCDMGTASCEPTK